MAERRYRSSIVVDESTNLALPYANVYLSDAQGNITRETIGTSTNEDGKFVIKAAPDEYITVSFVGLEKRTFKASQLPNLMKLKGGVQLKEFEVVARKDGKRKWMIAGLIGGGVLLVSLLGYAIYKSRK